MKQKAFLVTLQDDVVISASGATTGGHRGLNHLPGATFLGAAAGEIYHRFDRERAWQLFHSGWLRFNDALPITDTGHVTYPVPLCWHHAKGKKPLRDLGEPPDLLENHLHIAPAQRRKAEQLRPDRHGFVSLAGKREHHPLGLTMKTAIDPATGRASEGQLFGYTSLPAGARFLFTLEASDSLNDDLLKQVADALIGEQRLGRSRSAEYGRVEMQLLEAELSSPEMAPEPHQSLTL